MTPMKQAINKTREYLDYVEEHYDNVQTAFEIAKVKWKNIPVIYDDFKFELLRDSVEFHDFSKLSKHELVQYRMKFYPTKYEQEACESQEEIPYLRSEINNLNIHHDFISAWEHHKTLNSHHYQNWTNRIENLPYAITEVNIAHMCLDWIAMSMKFGDTALEFYEKEKSKIKATSEEHIYIKELLELYYKE